MAKRDFFPPVIVGKLYGNLGDADNRDRLAIINEKYGEKSVMVTDMGGVKQTYDKKDSCVRARIRSTLLPTRNYTRRDKLTNVGLCRESVAYISGSIIFPGMYTDCTFAEPTFVKKCDTDSDDDDDDGKFMMHNFVFINCIFIGTCRRCSLKYHNTKSTPIPDTFVLGDHYDIVNDGDDCVTNTTSMRS